MASADVDSLVRCLKHSFIAAGDERTSDDELLRRFSTAGDDVAFAAILRRLGPMVWNTCLRLLGSSPDAEDVFQATFPILARDAKSICGRPSLGGWLHGVQAPAGKYRILMWNPQSEIVEPGKVKSFGSLANYPVKK